MLKIKLMRKRGIWRYTRLMLLAALLCVGSAPAALAVDHAESNNYQASEMQFGGSSAIESCSGSFCSRASIGDINGGNSTSGPSTATFGPITSDDPLLEMIVDPGEANLGVMSAEQPSTKTTSIRVRNNLTNGYTLQIIGSPPKFGDHTIPALTSPTASDPGTEQFGINLVDNSTPDIGANLVFDPLNQLTFGEIDEDYNTPNQFMYEDGAVVARGLTNWGRTDYTLSMIINVSNTTPAGRYETEFSAVVIPAF